MRSIAKLRLNSRLKRHRRIRKKLSGTPDRPRLAVYRSHMHIYTQIVDDLAGKNGETLVAISTQSPGVRDTVKGKSKIEASREVGKAIAAAAKKVSIRSDSIAAVTAITVGSRRSPKAPARTD